MNVPFGILAWVLIWHFLPTVKTQTQALRFDWIGTGILAVILACYALAMTEAESFGFQSPLVLGLLAGACVSLALFLWIERRLTVPLLPLKLFRNLLLSTSLIISVLVYTVMMTAILVLPFFLDEGAHVSLVVSGLLLAIGPLITALLSVPASWLADRLGARMVMVIGLALMAGGCLFMSTLTVEAGIAGFIVRIALINFGLALFQTPNNAVVMETAHVSQRGMISGLLSLSRTLGLATGAAVMGSLLAEFVALATPASAAASPASITFGVQGTFLVSTAIASVSLLLVLITLRAQRSLSAK